jgi:hypothetical protein
VKYVRLIISAALLAIVAIGGCASDDDEYSSRKYSYHDCYYDYGYARYPYSRFGGYPYYYYGYPCYWRHGHGDHHDHDHDCDHDGSKPPPSPTPPPGLGVTRDIDSFRPRSSAPEQRHANPSPRGGDWQRQERSDDRATPRQQSSPPSERRSSTPSPRGSSSSGDGGDSGRRR